MRDEVAGDAVRGALDANPLEHEPQRTLHFGIGIEAESLCRRGPLVPYGRGYVVLAATRLADLCTTKSQPHPREFRLGHRALDTKQQAIVVVTWVIDALIVGDDDVRDAA
jgi:hypothetical protein